MSRDEHTGRISALYRYDLPVAGLWAAGGIAALRHMRSAGRGTIVQISSGLAIRSALSRQPIAGPRRALPVLPILYGPS